MPLPLPSLDDRDFTALMDEVRSLIPRYNPGWTNFNPSDPGITLFELFAYLVEQDIYRVNQIPRRSYTAFLRLLGIELAAGETLESGIQRAVQLVTERYRAVTALDYESLVFAKMEELATGLGGRVVVVNNADLENIPPAAQTLADVAVESHVSVVVIPRTDGDAEAWCDPDVLPLPAPSVALRAQIKALLNERRLLTVRVHVAAPVYRSVDITAKVALQDNVDPTAVRDDALERTRAFVDPLDGGQDGRGWPLGRALYQSELFQILEGTAGVDHVIEARMLVGGVEQDDLVLRPWELIAAGSLTIAVES